MRWLTLLAVCLLGICCAAGAPAQPAAAPATSSTAEKFQTLRRDWLALDKRLNELQDSYAKASPAARPVIKEQYTELVARSNEMLTQLREAAIAAYTAAPNKDIEVVRTLIGIVAYDYRRDDYDGALALA